MDRTFDSSVMKEATAPYPEILSPSFDYEAWVADKNNILLTEGKDVGCFTYEYEGVYSPHYFLKSRGKQAIDVTLRAFQLMFNEFGCQTLRGLTKTKLRAARWMARQYGFKSYGFVETDEGEHEIFIMTREEFFSHLDRRKK